jgi:hypothetical protein
MRTIGILFTVLILLSGAVCGDTLEVEQHAAYCHQLLTDELAGTSPNDKMVRDLLQDRINRLQNYLHGAFIGGAMSGTADNMYMKMLFARKQANNDASQMLDPNGPYMQCFVTCRDNVDCQNNCNPTLQARLHACGSLDWLPY